MTEQYDQFHRVNYPSLYSEGRFHKHISIPLIAELFEDKPIGATLYLQLLKFPSAIKLVLS